MVERGTLRINRLETYFNVNVEWGGTGCDIEDIDNLRDAKDIAEGYLVQGFNVQINEFPR